MRYVQKIGKIILVAIITAIVFIVVCRSLIPSKWESITENAQFFTENLSPGKTLYVPQASDDRLLYGPYSVIRVVDGDTIIVDIEGSDVRVRMIGIDTPESVHPDSTKNTDEGKQASQFTEDLVAGKKVYLEYDVEQNDQYGRTLAYVFLEDQATMVEEVLLTEGMATIMTIQPNIKYADRFYALQQNARNAGAGFWEGEAAA